MYGHILHLVVIDLFDAYYSWSKRCQHTEIIVWPIICSFFSAYPKSQRSTLTDKEGVDSEKAEINGERRTDYQTGKGLGTKVKQTLLYHPVLQALLSLFLFYHSEPSTLCLPAQLFLAINFRVSGFPCALKCLIHSP